MSPDLLLGATDAAEATAFWILSVTAVGGGIAMVSSRKAVHSALWLALTMVCLAFLYMLQGAYFLGIVQIVVYTGAVMMLFLFVLMLVGVDASDSLVETLRRQRIGAVLSGLAFGVLLIAALGQAAVPEAVGLDEANANGNAQGLAVLIFGRYLWAFEVTSALLITAALGAMVLTHREDVERKRTQRELSEDRIRHGRATPLAAPGVYARHNAVDTPGLLPDGTPSEESVPAALTARLGETTVPVSAGLPHAIEQGQSRTEGSDTS
jgi:NADH-quinone oxidoreductase subunit J